MARKPNNISVLQFDGQLISRLRVQRTAKGLEILAHDCERGPWGDGEEALEETLRTFVEKHALAEDSVCTVLPRHDITTRIVDLPTHSAEEAANMVRLSAEEYVPFSAEELIIDQCLLQKLPNGESRVMAVLAHKDVVQSHIQLLERVGLEPDRVFLSTACLAAAAMAAPSAAGKRFALVNLASGGIEAIVMEEGHLQFSRGVATKQDWALPVEEAGEAYEELAIEVRGSLAVYRRESVDGLGADTVYLSSDWTSVDRATGFLEQETGKDCFDAPFVKELATKGQEHLKGLPLVALGAALAAQDRAPLVTNLLPSSMTKHREIEGVKRTALQTAGIVAAILVALTVLYYQAIWQRESMVRELRRQVEQIGPSARGVASKQEQLHILRRQVERRGNVIELLARIFETAPESRLTVTRFTYERNDGINLYGHAKTVDDVHAFAQGLRGIAKGHLELLAGARSLYEKERGERMMPVIGYQIAIPFSRDEDSDSNI